MVASVIKFCVERLNVPTTTFNLGFIKIRINYLFGRSPSGHNFNQGQQQH